MLTKQDLQRIGDVVTGIIAPHINQLDKRIDLLEKKLVHLTIEVKEEILSLHEIVQKNQDDIKYLQKTTDGNHQELLAELQKDQIQLDDHEKRIGTMERQLYT
ncbi:hypothetical protein KC726_03450 [Candidatus Woesebacteria bacterium]|nr:hypothetical protein [Candidatus Woesebacteria bacterium]